MWNDQNLRELAGHVRPPLFFSGDVRAVRQLYPDREILFELSDDARLVVSEPIGDLPRRLDRDARGQLRSGRKGR